MGDNNQDDKFEVGDYHEFNQNLALEIEDLRSHVKDNKLCQDGTSIGLELEAWIADSSYRPAPQNAWLLKSLGHEQVVPELSKFNIEINSKVQRDLNHSLGNLEKELCELSELCNQTSLKKDCRVLFIGSLNTLSRDDLELHSMTESDRYALLNHQIMKHDNYRERVFSIRGKEELNFSTDHIMPVSATTSLQTHFKVPYSEFQKVYNASFYAAAPLVAVSANSPFLFGKELWYESRIPVFEQSMRFNPEKSSRVSLGYGYLDGDICEYFSNNQEEHDIFFPMKESFKPGSFYHNRLHGGTIWHWNRIIVEKSQDRDNYHARVEFRPCSAGPSMKDTIANTAFYLGLAYGLAKNFELEETTPFHNVEANFYQSARHSFQSRLRWIDGKYYNADRLILDKLLVIAEQGLAQLGIDDKEAKSYLSMIEARASSQKNGAYWQKEFVQTHGKDFSKMLDSYWNQQTENKPVHLWD